MSAVTPSTSPSPTASPRIRVGFIGLGSQGAPIARRIIDAGLPVTLWARLPATLEPFAGTHAATAETPALLAAASDIVGLCVRDDADIATVTGGPDGVLAGLRPGAVIAVHSTVHPDTCRRLAEQAAAVGAHVVDAPVSGGQASAGGTLDRIAAHAGDLLAKDVRLLTELLPPGLPHAVAGASESPVDGPADSGMLLAAALDALTRMRVPLPASRG